MDFKPFKITFHLNGSGVYYDPLEPQMLDALITCALANGRDLYHDENPPDLVLPLATWEIGGHWGYRASGLFPVEPDAVETVLMYRKKYNLRDADTYLRKGAPNLTGGPYRENNLPLPLLLARELRGYCVGDAPAVHAALRGIRYIGRRRSLGKGRVVKVETMPIDADFSCVKDGCAMRPLPYAKGFRQMRIRPPYWHTKDRVQVCEIGDAYDTTAIKRRPRH